MPAPVYASNYTYVGAGQTDASIGSGGSILVHGIVISSVTIEGQVILTEANGSTIIAELTVLADTSFEIKTSFLAKNGLAVTTDSSTVCTVFHSNPGA